MEMEGWKMLWQRSIDKCNFKYTEVISDGSFKGISAVQKLNLYPVNKLECVNHATKQLTNALRKVSKDKKLGGKKPGRLTKDKIKRLGYYFGKSRSVFKGKQFKIER